MFHDFIKNKSNSILKVFESKLLKSLFIALFNLTFKWEITESSNSQDLIHQIKVVKLLSLKPKTTSQLQ